MNLQDNEDIPSDVDITPTKPAKLSGGRSIKKLKAKSKSNSMKYGKLKNLNNLDSFYNFISNGESKSS